MNQHFTEAEFETCLSAGVRSLNPLRQLHIKSCADCRAVLSGQAEMDRVLSDIKPQRMSRDIADKIISELKQPAQKNIRLNWLIAASLILTVILISIAIFNPQAKAYRPFMSAERLIEKLTDIQSKNLKIPEIIPVETALHSLKQITEFFIAPHTAFLIFLFFVLGLYLLADQYFQKTFYKNS